MFNLKPDSLPESDTEKMSLLLWKWAKRSETNFSEVSVENEMDDWLSFAEQNYA